jgi:membrane-associated phospholipid phosphatase
MSTGTRRPTVPAGQAEGRFGIRALLAAIALVLVAVPFGLLLFLVQDKWSPLLRADTGARDDLHSYAVQHGPFVTAMRMLSFIGSTTAWLALFTAVAAWLLWRRLPRLALFVAVTVVGSSLLNQVVKEAVHRARPVLPNPVAHANGLSFPSGHAQAALVGSAVLLLAFLPLLRGGWRALAVVGAALLTVGIGFSRVALGVHYVSDVLAGYVLGAAWVSAMTAAFNSLRMERGRSKARPADGLEPDVRWSTTD